MKFKIGDKVKCVKTAKCKYCIEGCSSCNGAGWKLDHEFIITEITDEIYWKGIGRNGVCENALEFAIREEIIYEN